MLHLADSPKADAQVLRYPRAVADSVRVESYWPTMTAVTYERTVAGRLDSSAIGQLVAGVSWLVSRINVYIPPIIEPGKEVFHHWMTDGFQNIIRLQILFSNIGRMITPMN